MKPEAGKEMDRRCVINWLIEVYVTPSRAFSEYTDDELKMFAHDALVFLKDQNCNCCGTVFDVAYKAGKTDAVVRCKDCKHSCDILFNVDKDTKKIKTDTIKTYCKKHDCSQKLDWFCADGERKDNTK